MHRWGGWKPFHYPTETAALHMGASNETVGDGLVPDESRSRAPSVARETMIFQRPGLTTEVPVVNEATGLNKLGRRIGSVAGKEKANRSRASNTVSSHRKNGDTSESGSRLTNSEAGPAKRTP